MTQLKELNLSHVRIYNNVSVFGNGFMTMVDYDEAKLDDSRAMIGECTSLEVLKIASDEISSLDFVVNLCNLRQIDCSDNYIDDVTPLALCPKLEEVIGKNNVVEDWSPLSDVNFIK